MLNIKKSLFILGLLPFQLIFGQTDSVYRFTLNQAIDYAMENNYNLKNSKLDIEAAKKQVWETTASGLPQISATVDFSYNFGEESTVNPFEGIYAPVEAVLGYIHTPELAEEAFDAVMPSNGQQDVSFVPDQALTATVSVNQLVFSGEYIVGLQASKTYLQLSKNQNDKTELDVKEAVYTNYFALLSLQENSEIIGKNMSLLERNLEENRKMFDQGFVDQTTVDQIEYNYNLLENNLKQLERQLRVSHDLFKITLGLEISDTLILEDNLEIFVDNVRNDVMLDSLNFDINDNIDYRMLENQVDINALSLKREKAAYLPSINAYYRYNNDLIDLPVDFTPPHTVGATASIPIFSSGMRNAKVQQAKIELEKAKNTKALQEKNIKTGALQAKYNLRNAFEKFENEQRNFDLARKIFDDTEIKFNEGMASSFELTQANTQFLTATSNYTTAIVNLLEAKTQMNKIYNNF